MTHLESEIYTADVTLNNAFNQFMNLGNKKFIDNVMGKLEGLV